jgi:hypothetical protein
VRSLYHLPTYLTTTGATHYTGDDDVIFRVVMPCGLEFYVTGSHGATSQKTDISSDILLPGTTSQSRLSGKK